ncbi:type VII secretion-associated serine protease mycosin [Mesobacillus persicus]|uniref:Type VII secretion-associated serine protease mycosin n=1 Tax=Mesobacillus persicus TaxID=930146 RepID=A0A1H7W585_9BACI|nr:S8 family peptidase [Mesobacillus persicus]SEM16686.1 type VII secretion-associated serine protease mycosin [Mesobacillus persicus]
MNRSKIILLIAVSTVLVIIASSSLFQTQEINRIQNIKETPLILDGTKKDSHLLQINNVTRGNKLKHHLDNRVEVTHFHHNQQDTSHYLDHEVAVNFTTAPTKADLEQILQDIDGRVIKQDGLLLLFRSNSIETPEMLEYFQGKPKVDYAEPQYLLMQNSIRNANGLNLPNDQYYQEEYQWNLPAIGTEQGWTISRGNEDITVAVVDTGVDLDHPDLVNRLVAGYNVLGENQHPDDDNGHGTHVAGIIASETNNREGIAGVTWYNKIMPIKAMSAEGYGTTFDISKGIIWAVDHGADVINLSLGNYKESNVLKRAIRYAYEKDVVLIAAAGNDSSQQPSYPAAYPEVISVSAVSYDGSLAGFSNYGSYINISAPGEYIPSTYFNEQYASLSGTSMAAPHVAGLAGLMKATNSNLTNKDIMSIIQNSARDLGKRGKDIQFGNGLINVNQALKEAQVAEGGKTTRNKIRERLNIFR